MERLMFMGLDIGSTALKLVLLDERGAVVSGRYRRIYGAPLEAAVEELAALETDGTLARLDGAGLTGSGVQGVAEAYGIAPVNEVVAHAAATALLCPEARSIIEIGGEDAKLIILEPGGNSGDGPSIKDLAMNSLCAAGTGSFLDQQAARLGVDIENQWGAMALRSARPPRIAGRCSVFAKSDMIHLQQQGAADYDIIAGLCFAMARNFKAVVCNGKQASPPVCFQGGVAANAGMRRAFAEVFELDADQLLVPQFHALMGAIGAALEARRTGAAGAVRGAAPLRQYLSRAPCPTAGSGRPLSDSGGAPRNDPCPFPAADEVRVFLGVDVGSISTNVVAIDADGRVLAREYIMTAGRPLMAITDGLFRVGAALEDRRGAHKLCVCGCGTTGSGRYLTGDFIGADLVKNEITAHAEGAIHARPDVDTIFEIGGQDSKYIRIENGAVVDFAMNKVCAAGTGSFIEEQAERLGVNLKNGEFNRLALSSAAPAAMGERCTVFIETELNLRRRQGAAVSDLCAGLCYSIARNYLGKVVENRRIGDVVLFQGGTAYNRGVKAAFERLTGKNITVPHHHDILGAIGMALLAKKAWDGKTPSGFRGFDLRDRLYETSNFECADCANRCEIRVVAVRGEPPLYYGSRCGKLDESRRARAGKDLPRLFAERNRMLEQFVPPQEPGREPGRPLVGLPRATNMWELLPMFAVFFRELGFDVALSESTNPRIVAEGIARTAAEPCFPIKTAHGHVANLVAKAPDYICLPVIIDMPNDNRKFCGSYVCPYVQSLPFLAPAAIDGFDWKQRLLRPILHLSRGLAAAGGALARMATGMGVEPQRARAAAAKAFDAQAGFRKALTRRGREIFENFGANRTAVVVLSRPYNGCDPGLNVGIPDKFRDMDCLALPMDMLPAENIDISADYPDMYWSYGRRIIEAARFIAADPRLFPVYITNFGCGPDSFILKYVERELRGKPCLVMEVDEHSSDVGVITRCEAFLDSLRNFKHRRPVSKHSPQARKPGPPARRTVFIPHMSDHGVALAAAMRACGDDACAMPMSDSTSLAFGRKCTTGRECYPCILTTGDMLRQAHSPGFDPARSAFFMPTTMGPCRFGQYNRFQRMVLDDSGLQDVPLVLLDQDKNYRNDLRALGGAFRTLAWQGIVFIDILQRLCMEARPYETAPGECDALYAETLRRCEQRIEARQSLAPLLAGTVEGFSAIRAARSTPKPRVGVVGEIFVRCNSFANNFVVRKLEKLGLEVSLPSIGEWINYTQWARVCDAWAVRNFPRFAMEKMVSLVSRLEKRRLFRELRPECRKRFNGEEISEVIRGAGRYLDPSIRGEALLSMARSIEYAGAGCSGVLNLAPFNCMPGTIVNALLTRFQRDRDVPVLKLMHDGVEQASENVRLEAFARQCSQRIR